MQVIVGIDYEHLHSSCVCQFGQQLVVATSGLHPQPGPTRHRAQPGTNGLGLVENTNRGKRARCTGDHDITAVHVRAQIKDSLHDITSSDSVERSGWPPPALACNQSAVTFSAARFLI